jgi:SAM-dependent methyltransferase
VNLFSKLNVYIKNRLAIPVSYDEDFFAQEWFDNWNGLKGLLAELLESDPAWRKIIDFGCGPGLMIDYMNERGKKYYGFEPSQKAKDLYFSHFGKNSDLYYSDLNLLKDMKFDLLVSFDVFEHMNDAQIHDSLRCFNQVPELLLNISRNKYIPGHINLKSDQGWIDFMNKQGYEFSIEKTQKIRNLYLQKRPQAQDLWNKNIFIFKKQEILNPKKSIF